MTEELEQIQTDVHGTLHSVRIFMLLSGISFSLMAVVAVALNSVYVALAAAIMFLFWHSLRLSKRSLLLTQSSLARPIALDKRFDAMVDDLKQSLPER